MMTPVWRLSNGRGPSWHFGQAQVTTDTSFQVSFQNVSSLDSFFTTITGSQEINGSWMNELFFISPGVRQASDMMRSTGV